MARTQVEFFATRSDLEELVAIVEAQRQLTFIRAGLFDDPSVESVESLLSLRDLGIAPSGSAVQCPAYLVATSPFVPVVRSVPQRRGGTKHAVDQLENPQTIVFRPGGIFDGAIVIAGSLGTVSTDSASLELYRVFLAAIRPRFCQIKSYRVGRDAARLLDAGSRLTADVRSPQLYDLTRH